ncbi:MAG: hypothetical protein ABI415_00455 [Flavitalea sp.]
MKTNVSNFKMLPLPLLILMVCFSVQGFSQPDYIFKNSTLYSGTNLQVGAKYKFTNVKPGVDAYLTITVITPGVVITQLDGSSGYTEAIQPTLTIPANTNGYAEYNIQFVTAGTLTPLIQSSVSVTGIDIDGVNNYDSANHDLHEFDAIDVNSSVVGFSTLGGELSIGQSGTWFTATNIGGVDYGGRDTAAKAVMFTVEGTNISSLNFRTGINNQTNNSATRLASIYFRRFVYPNSTLAVHESTRLKPSHNSNDFTPSFNVLPNVIQGSAKLDINAGAGGWAVLEFVDYSGRVVMHQQLAIDKGQNTIPLFNISKLSKGNYVAVLKMDGLVYSDKVIRQ